MASLPRHATQDRRCAGFGARQVWLVKHIRHLALDLCLFINGLSVATFELKNRLTKQTVEDAVQQYKRDRNPKELLFQFGRCMVHFAMDDQEVHMCTHLKGKDSWFLPFNKGFKDGAGNPPNPSLPLSRLSLSMNGLMFLKRQKRKCRKLLNELRTTERKPGQGQ